MGAGWGIKGGFEGVLVAVAVEVGSAEGVVDRVGVPIACLGCCGLGEVRVDETTGLVADKEVVVCVCGVFTKFGGILTGVVKGIGYCVRSGVVGCCVVVVTRVGSAVVPLGCAGVD